MNVLKTAAAAIVTVALFAGAFFGGQWVKDEVDFQAAYWGLKTGKQLTPDEERRLDKAGQMRITNLQKKLELLHKASDAKEMAALATDVLGELFSQASFEGACLHHRSYAGVKDAGAAITESTDEASRRYVSFLQICVSEGPRASMLGAVGAHVIDDIFADVRGIADTVDILLDVIGALGPGDRWEEIRTEILQAREYHQSEFAKAAEALIDGWLRDVIADTQAPTPAGMV